MDLTSQKCQVQLATVLEAPDAGEYLAQVPGWEISGAAIQRRFSFKNFKQTMFFINALAWVCEQEGHHPDARFSFGYCEVSFTTHDAGGLTLNDFICAAKLNRLISNS